jgi:phenylacetic acid degradation operon negative regulatory protein
VGRRPGAGGDHRDGRGPAERADPRTRPAALRLAELREGVWLRPADPGRRLSAGPGEVAECGTARPDRSAREFAAGLWPLDARSGTARALLGHVDRATRPAERLTAFAAVVRQLLADPVLLPADWPDDAPLPADRPTTRRGPPARGTGGG